MVAGAFARRLLLGGCTLLAGCGSCGRGSTSGPDASATPVTSATVTAEPLPRCRAEAQRITIPGADPIVGDVAVGPSGLLVGLIRNDGGKRVASVLRLASDLATSSIVNVGSALGDDPPPSPRFNGATGWVAFLDRQTSPSGVKLRALKLARVFEPGANDAVPRVETTVLQQADESTAFDVAWNEGAGLAAWDEDAPTKEDAGAPGTTERGFVKVQGLAEGSRPRVASPETSDAESPRLVPRPGGFWLAWLARKVEEEAYSVEGPGEQRAFRWVEALALDARGEAAGPVRRISPEKGRAASFDLGRSGADLVVVVQDEAAPAEGAGARIVRYVVGEKVASSDLVDGGVGHSSDVITGSAAEGARFLAWTDAAERTHLTPLGAGLVAGGSTTHEPTLDNARALAATPDGLYALVGRDGNAAEVRRFVCK